MSLIFLPGFENFYPKGKGNPRPSKDPKKGGGSEGDNGSNKGEGEQGIFSILSSWNFQQSVLFSITLTLALALTSYGQSDVQEISFQKFKNELLAKDLVERLEVTGQL